MRNSISFFVTLSLFILISSTANAEPRVGGGGTGNAPAPRHEPGKIEVINSREYVNPKMYFDAYYKGLLAEKTILLPTAFEKGKLGGTGEEVEALFRAVVGSGMGGRHGQFSYSAMMVLNGTGQMKDVFNKLQQTEGAFNGPQRLRSVDLTAEGKFTPDRQLGESSAAMKLASESVAELAIPLENEAGVIKEDSAEYGKMKLDKSAELREWADGVTDGNSVKIPMAAMAQATLLGIDFKALERKLLAKKADPEIMKAVKTTMDGAFKTFGPDALGVIRQAQIAFRKAIVRLDSDMSPGALKTELIELAVQATLAQNRRAVETGDGWYGHERQILHYQAEVTGMKPKDIAAKCAPAKIGQCNILPFVPAQSALGRIIRQYGDNSMVEYKGKLRKWGELKPEEKEEVHRDNAWNFCNCMGRNPTVCNVFKKAA